MSDHSDFWKGIQATSARLHHSLNLAGKTLADCTAEKCKNGITEQGRSDHDEYGPIYREQVYCRACGGRGQVEVACSPELELAAVEKEVAGLQNRARELRKKVKRSGRGMEGG